MTPPAYRTTWLEPISLLSGLAGVTRTMRLGTLVLVLPFRDPVAFAKEWATLDVLSGGRSILGVGVGWHEGEFAALRIPFRERGRRMNEMLESITALWAGDHVTYEGQFYRFEDLTIEPKPVQRPHPPIWIGGGTQPSEKIYGQQVDTVRPVLRRIARYASTWVPHSSATAEMVAGDWAVIREEMAGFGRDPQDMTKVYSNFIHVLAPGEAPDSASGRFRTFSGMDLDTGRSSICSVRPRRWPSGSRARSTRSAASSTSSSIRSTGTLRRSSASPPTCCRVSTTDAWMASYVRPTSLDEALTALAARPRVLLAGGTDIYPPRVGRPVDDDILDVTALPELRTITTSPDGIRIPALATWMDLVRHDLPPAFDGLKAAARAIGGVQIQHRGNDRRQPVQRLAGCRRAAQPHRPRRAGRDQLHGRPARARGRRVRRREPADGAAGRRARHGRPGAASQRDGRGRHS